MEWHCPGCQCAPLQGPLVVAAGAICLGAHDNTNRAVPCLRATRLRLASCLFHAGLTDQAWDSIGTKIRQLFSRRQDAAAPEPFNAGPATLGLAAAVTPANVR